VDFVILPILSSLLISWVFLDEEIDLRYKMKTKHNYFIKMIMGFRECSKSLLFLSLSYVWAYEEIKYYFQYCLLDISELNCMLIPY
jgi:hypothetical protein